MANSLVKTSKFLALVLRHQPDLIGLTLDANGWANVDDLINRANAHGHALSRATIDRTVADNDKQRFALSSDRTRIRANQGHSVGVELDLPPADPPEFLYHGTATRFLDSIRAGGLLPGSRRHVHLSDGPETADRVGARHGVAVVLTVRAGAMHAAGHPFWVSTNGVWLVERVPTVFVEFPG